MYGYVKGTFETTFVIFFLPLVLKVSYFVFEKTATVTILLSKSSDGSK